MKKFLITLFFLAAIAGTLFFFGWVQFNVPAGSYGIINSKTHGVDPVLVKSGEFRWVWYKLIPTNVQITVFRLETYKFPIEFNSSLPSGDTYASFSGLGSTDFSWNLKGELSFSINPDMLIPLVTKNNMADQEALDAYIQNILQNIKVIILRTLTAADFDSQRLENILSGSPDTQMENEIKNRYPEIQDFSFVITSARFPDFVLYRQVRLLYEEFLTRQREYVTAAALGRTAEKHIETQLHFTELERYGELLTKYPVLLQYLQMTMGND
uniref:Band 7 domain-containing protein n=1 Tax=uncultured bacterium contig00060 TaxID=1181543 RepID=A0A806KJK8_9BACT|nr:hypothetical protein [uncultured bacterium contig00060]